MKLDWDNFKMSKILSISVIGKYGNKDDIQFLLDDYYSIEERLSSFDFNIT